MSKLFSLCLLAAVLGGASFAVAATQVADSGSGQASQSPNVTAYKHGLFAVFSAPATVPVRQMPGVTPADPPILLGQLPIVSVREFERVSQDFDMLGRAIITIALTPKGKSALAAYTRANIGGTIAIMIDGRVLSTPTIMEPITAGKVELAGNFSVVEAQALVVALRSGK